MVLDGPPGSINYCVYLLERFGLKIGEASFDRAERDVRGVLGVIGVACGRREKESEEETGISATASGEFSATQPATQASYVCGICAADYTGEEFFCNVTIAGTGDRFEHRQNAICGVLFGQRQVGSIGAKGNASSCQSPA